MYCLTQAAPRVQSQFSLRLHRIPWEFHEFSMFREIIEYSRFVATLPNHVHSSTKLRNENNRFSAQLCIDSLFAYNFITECIEWQSVCVSKPLSNIITSVKTEGFLSRKLLSRQIRSVKTACIRELCHDLRGSHPPVARFCRSWDNLCILNAKQCVLVHFHGDTYTEKVHKKWTNGRFVHEKGGTKNYNVS